MNFDNARSKSILTVGLIVVLIVGVLALSVALSRTVTTRTVGSMEYCIGTLDAEGEFVDEDTAICSKDFLIADGLKCKVARQATIEYKIFFYDKDREFISATEDLTEDYDSDTPEGARFVKIMITPTNDAEITIFEKSGIAKQLTVTVSK